MSVIIKTFKNTRRISPIKKNIRASLHYCNCLSVRKYTDAPKRFLLFDEVVAQRRNEARRSIVVQVNSEASFNDLYGYCSKYASINGIHHYKNSGAEHFMLIEFNSEENVKDVLQSCSAHQKDHDILALQSPFLWFRACSGKKEKFNVPTTLSLVTKDGNTEITEEKLSEELMHCETVSDQIQLLYERTTLNDLGVRLRYMVARQLEIAFDSLYANIAVWPFGSSVNGYGRMGCDLDLVLTNTLTDEMSSPSRRLVYQGKLLSGGARAGPQHTALVGELVEQRVAGCARVQRILHARVPIVKYAHELAALDCDLCLANMSGVYMSELVWLLGSLDARVRPLVGAVRRWAAAAGLTSAHPGRWITNFPLTLLVLFFLQQDAAHGAVLPAVNYLVNRAGKEDIRIAEDDINCTFLRDINKLPPTCYGQNQSNLQMLLLQFFEFYAQFDFQEKAVSINEGRAIRKPNSLPMYIVNPLDQTMNVSRNVSFDECERFKMEVRNAAWQLEAALDGQKSDDWGLLGLIEKKASRGLKKLLRVGNSHRLVSVKDLFSDSEENVPESGLRSKLKRLTRKSDKDVERSVKELKEHIDERGRSNVKNEQKIKFKNSQVASEVFRIRRDKMV